MLKHLFFCCKRNFQDKSLWLSFIAGLSLVFAYSPFSQWWLVFIVLPVWFNYLIKQINHSVPLDNPAKNEEKIRRKTATKHGFIFALGWFASGISWVHVSIDQFGGMPLIISLLLMLLLCCYLALYPTLALYLVSRLSTNKQLNLWLVPGIWFVTEYLRGVVLTGFPWLSLGYSQIDGPLSSLAPIIGEVGITAIVLLVSVAISQLITFHSKKFAITVLGSVIFLTVIAQQQTWLTPSGKTIKTALVQGNIKQEIKWQAEQQWPTMLKYLDLTRVNYDADLIIWPESAIPAIESLTTSQEFLDMANRSAHLNNSTIISGIIN
jgi:apolipoprotein N-acyltransferase